jgi:hypothetical protein
MNYITRLELENGILKSWVKLLKEYTNSSKFHYPDEMMNTNDLRLRFSELDGLLESVEDAVKFCPNYDCEKHGKITAFSMCGKCGTETELLIDALSDPC